MKSFIFFGSSHFSVIVLEELRRSNLIPKIIVTTPDQPAGRGLKLQENPVKIFTKHNSIVYLTSIKELLVQNLDNCIGLVAAYGRIIGPNTLSKFDNQIYCIHPSLLPKYRGSSPLQAQILNQESHAGVTLFQIDTDIDHGPIVSQSIDKISPDDSTETLGKRLFISGAHLFTPLLSDSTPNLLTQDHKEATFTQKISRDDGKIDFSILQDIISTKVIPDQIKIRFQAFSPWPGLWAINEAGRRIKLINLDPITIQEEGKTPKKIQS